MKKQLLLFIFISVFMRLNFAQTIDFQFSKIFDNVGTGQLNGAVDTEIDASGNVFILGFFSGSTDFDPSASNQILTCSMGLGMYLTKFNSNGVLQWSKSWVPSNSLSTIKGYSLALDGNQNIVIVGSYADAIDMDPDAGVQNVTTINGNSGIYVLKLNASGNFVWVKTMSSPGTTGSDCSGKAVKTDGQNNIYITGDFQLTVDFNPNAGVFNLTSATTLDKDAFVLALDSFGNFLWANGFGGDGDDFGNDIHLNSLNQVSIVGNFYQTCDFNTGAGSFLVTSNGQSDAFISQFDNSGNWLWTKTLGGTSYDEGTTLVIDGSNNMYVGGSFQNTLDINTDASIQTISSLGVRDHFILKLANSGSFIWGKQIGGLNDDQLICGTLNASNKIVFAGMTSFDLDLDPSAGVANINSTKTDAGTIVIIDSVGNLIDYHYLVGHYSYVNSVASRSNQLYAVGYYEGTCDFDPTGINTSYTVGVGARESYFMKFNQCVPVNYIFNLNACSSVLIPNTSDLITSSDTLFYSYLDQNGCDSILEYRVQIFGLPAIVANIGDTSICEGNQLTLYGNGGVSYSWNNGIQNNVAFTPSSNTTYVLTGIDANGCTNTDTITISLNPIPAIDLGPDQQVSSTNQILDAGSGWNSYLWSTNAITQQITVSQNGIYSVLVSNSFGCYNSDTVEITFTAGIEEQDLENEMKLFPNPVKDVFTIELNSVVLNGKLSVFSLNGVLIYEKEGLFGNKFTFELDREFCTGIYRVEMTGGQNKMNHLILIK